MKSIILFLLVAGVATGQPFPPPSPACDIPAIYNFGDSNSDTGGIAAAFYPPGSPSGETFFKRPVGRASDGRLIIDFVGKPENRFVNIYSSFIFFDTYSKFLVTKSC